MQKNIEVLGFVRPTGVVFRFEGKRYIAFVDTEIVNEEEKTVAKLADWRLVYADTSHSVAVFSNGADYATIPGKGP